MPATALAIDEEGEDEEEDEEDRARRVRSGVRRAAMYPLTSKGHSRFRTPLVFLLVLACLFTITNASPLHPMPPHRGESSSIPIEFGNTESSVFAGDRIT